MTAFRPTDSKREEFRKYLEKAGVMDALTKVLVALYEEPEKPNDALEYLKSNLGANDPDKAEVENLRQEVEAAKAELETLKQENADLRARLEKLEADAPPPGDAAAASAEPPVEAPPPAE